MSGFLLFGGVLALLLTAVILAAIRAGEDTGASLDPAERRDAAIDALRDVELDYQTGKLTADEYETVRDRLEREALAARDAIASPREATRRSNACSSCAAPLERGAAFCSSCGAPTRV